MIKRSFRVLKQPELPPKRPFTIPELRFLKEKFGNEFRWSEIDTNGNIVLIKKESKMNAGIFYITDEDLKKELQLRRSIGVN